MSDVPLRSDLDRMVDRYLGELALALQRLPVSERDHLLGEIREHIAELRAERPPRDAWDMEALLNRVGLPEDIAAAALENVEDAHHVVDPEAVPAPVPVHAASTVTPVPVPAPAPPQSWSRRSRLFVGIAAAAIVLVAVVSVAATRHGEVFTPGNAPSSVAPARGPLRPSAPSRRTVPVVIGQSLAQATVDLQAAGFSVASVSNPSNVVPSGEVFSQSPVGGSFVFPGGMITLEVSSGPPS